MKNDAKLQELEALVTEVHGKGACVSIDHGRDSGESGMIVRVWSASGHELANARARSAETAVRALIRRGAK